MVYCGNCGNNAFLNSAHQHFLFPAMAGRATLYDRLLQDLETSTKVKQEVDSGRRIGFYRLKSQLGSGNFAQVKLGIHLLTNEKVAVKIIDKTRLDDDTSRLLSREISSMERLCHENLIQLFEVHESFSRLCLVMEYAGEGDLQSRVTDNGPFSEDKARAVFAQMTAGIHHMHASGVCHRDLKPENVLYVSNTQIKIGDFGFSTPFTDEALSTFCGSPAFAAPELLQEQNYLGPPVDMWALGATLYYMVTGNVPFTGGTVPQIKESVLRGSYSPPKRVGTLCRELVARLLAMQARDRPSITAVLQDAWLEGVKEATYPATTNVVDDEIVTQMMELGVPVGEDTSCLLGEPRSAMAGTYRILLHRKLLTHSQPQELDTCTQEPNLTNSSSVQRKSRVCTIL